MWAADEVAVGVGIERIRADEKSRVGRCCGGVECGE